MCLTEWKFIYVNNISDITCRLIRYLHNKQGVLPKLSKSSTLLNDRGVLEDEFNVMIKHMPIYLLFGAELHKLVGYKDNLNDASYNKECDGFVTINSLVNKDKCDVTFDDVQVYLYTNKNELINIGKPLCLKHLIHKDDSKQVASANVKLFSCAFTEWTIMTDLEYEVVKPYIPEETHILY